MATQMDVMRACLHAGLRVATYSPGDGVTRYRFFRDGEPGVRVGYYDDGSIYTALGAKEAISFVHGYSMGYSDRREQEGRP